MEENKQNNPQVDNDRNNNNSSTVNNDQRDNNRRDNKQPNNPNQPRNKPKKQKQNQVANKPQPGTKVDTNLKVVEQIEIEVPDPEYDASEDVATLADIEAYAREAAEKRARKQQKPAEISRDEMEEVPEVENPEGGVDPYLDPDPSLPWVKFDDSPYLPRGCNHCPKSYVPIEESEMRSCCKVGSHNWMKGIRQPCAMPFDCVEVRFKNNRKDFYRLPEGIDVSEGDVVAVEGAPGHDVGIVSLIGEACRIQMEKKNVDPSNETIKKLFRRAKTTDIERWTQAIMEEHNTLIRTRAISEELGLVMKVNDVEYQGDHSKAIFYYTADERVDFRSLIKVLAEEFHVRVEMRQIGVRQEAGKVGGIGTCGRELCCSTWLTNFKSVTTSVAKAQQILPNPQKLAGQCGKLKCCLNFEYEVYVDALKKFPPANTAIRFKKGLALYKKTDVLRGIMWYAYEGENDLYAIGADDVKAIIEMNQRQEYPECLEDFQKELMSTAALTSETSEAEFERELKLLADTNDDNGTHNEEKPNAKQGNERRGRNNGDRNNGDRNNGDRNNGDRRNAPRNNDHRNNRDDRNDRRSNREERPERRNDREECPERRGEREERPERRNEREERPERRGERRGNNDRRTSNRDR